MVPDSVLYAINNLSQKEIEVVCESFKSIFGSEYCDYPFSDSNRSVPGEWHRSDILHYLNTIDFTLKHTICLEIMSVITTVLMYRQFGK